jgi:hypothetical protein
MDRLNVSDRLTRLAAYQKSSFVSTGARKRGKSKAHRNFVNGHSPLPKAQPPFLKRQEC